MPRRNWSNIASGIGAGLIFVAVVGWSLLTESPSEQRRAAERAEQAYQAERQALAALLLNPTEQAIAAEARERREERRQQQDLDAQQLMAVAAIVGVAASIAGLVFLAFTVLYARKAWEAARDSADADNAALELTRTQLNEARDTAVEQRMRIDTENATQKDRFDRQLAEAKRAADAARDSADNASFIGRNQARAYVHVAAARMDRTQSATLLGVVKKSQLYLTLANVGSTPTKLVRYYVASDIEDFSSVYSGYKEINLPALWETFNFAPNDAVELRAYVAKLDERVTEWRKKNAEAPIDLLFVSIRGRVVYKDVFDNEHFTDFGYYCTPPEDGVSEAMDPMTDGFARYEPVVQKK